MPYLYILQSELTGRYNIGSAVDVLSRLADHNSGNTLFTKLHPLRKLVYAGSFESLNEARQREREVKSWKNADYMVKILKLSH